MKSNKKSNKKFQVIECRQIDRDCYKDIKVYSFNTKDEAREYINKIIEIENYKEPRFRRERNLRIIKIGNQR
jgi:hypothetical protein